MADHVRRAVVVVLTALALLVAPQIAHAAFLGSATQSMTVSTATLAAPTNVAGTRQCLSPRGFSATINDFDHEGPDGVVYRYSIYRGTATTPFVTLTSTSSSATITTRAQQSGTNTWRLAITAEYQSWTSPEWTRTYAC